MILSIEVEQEADDGEFIADVTELPGVLCYGKTPDEAIRKATALALRVISDRVAHGELEARGLHVEFATP